MIFKLFWQLILQTKWNLLQKFFLSFCELHFIFLLFLLSLYVKQFGNVQNTLEIVTIPVGYFCCESWLHVFSVIDANNHNNNNKEITEIK